MTSATGATYAQPVVPVQDDASPAVKAHVGAAHASSSVPAVLVSSGVYAQPAVPVQDDASPAVKVHVGAAHASSSVPAVLASSAVYAQPVGAAALQ